MTRPMENAELLSRAIYKMIMLRVIEGFSLNFIRRHYKQKSLWKFETIQVVSYSDLAANTVLKSVTIRLDDAAKTLPPLPGRTRRCRRRARNIILLLSFSYYRVNLFIRMVKRKTSDNVHDNHNN